MPQAVALVVTHQERLEGWPRSSKAVNSPSMMQSGKTLRSSASSGKRSVQSLLFRVKIVARPPLNMAKPPGCFTLRDLEAEWPEGKPNRGGSGYEGPR